MARRKLRRFRFPEEPTQSDKLLILSGEDMIDICFGPHDSNVANFKIMQTVLYLLARQMRVLEQDVEFKFSLIDDRLIQMRQDLQDLRTAAALAESAVIDDSQRPMKKPKTQNKAEPASKRRGAKDKIIIVEKEKGSTTPEPASHIGNIEVVSRDQFSVLEAKVQELLKAPPPASEPTLPEDKQLRAALADGTATLPDTMDALQVDERIKIAEKGLRQMANLLTRLTSSGAIPDAIADQFDDMVLELKQLEAIREDGDKEKKHKHVKIDPLTKSTSSTSHRPTSASSTTASKTKSLTSVDSKVSVISTVTVITHIELFEALDELKATLQSAATSATSRCTTSAERAKHNVKSIGVKMGVAHNLKDRITALSKFAYEHTAKLSGFTSKLSNLFKNFNEEMDLISSDVKGGLVKLGTTKSNESVSLAKIKDGSDHIEIQLDQTLQVHGKLVGIQKQLTEELKSLNEWVEMLHEQKTSRQEVFEGIKDKAPLSLLEGLLSEDEFDKRCQQLLHALKRCSDHFTAKDLSWMNNLRELSKLNVDKAKGMQLAYLREEAADVLRDAHQVLLALEDKLGDTESARLTRALAVGAQCGACLTPGLMEARAPSLGAPPPLPALLLHTQERPTEQQPPRYPAPPELRTHIAKRWVGGSHTLLTCPKTLNRKTIARFDLPPTERYMDYGIDDRLYKMEKEVEPCLECKPVPTSADECQPTPPMCTCDCPQ